MLISRKLRFWLVPPLAISRFRSVTGISGQKSHSAFKDGAQGKSGKDVAGPMREQNDARRDESRSDGPNDVALGRRQLSCSRSHGADMHGMAGRKGIIGIAGQSDAVQMPDDGLSVRPDLVESSLQNMRSSRSGCQCQENMWHIAAVENRCEPKSTIRPQDRAARARPLPTSGPARPLPAHATFAARLRA